MLKSAKKFPKSYFVNKLLKSAKNCFVKKYEIAKKLLKSSKKCQKVLKSSLLKIC